MRSVGFLVERDFYTAVRAILNPSDKYTVVIGFSDAARNDTDLRAASKAGPKHGSALHDETLPDKDPLTEWTRV